jgi:peptidoglycan/LPS O-acetylase OafA/YrhL
MVLITNPVFQTYIFIAILVIAVLLSLRKKKDEGVFPVSTTNELKGLAILTVIFGHIGYFLVTGNLFLYPLSTISGVGVDLFLFLSGYGLTVSAIKKSRTIGNFYKDRLLKLLIPLWIVLIASFLLDFFVLNKSYPINYIVSSFLGFFPKADMYNDINSPLWYFTFILFYYLLFPLVFFKKRPWLSAIVIYLISYILLSFNLGFISGVNYFYSTHYWAFPIGIFLGWLSYIAQGLQRTTSNLFAKIDSNKILVILKNALRCVLILVLIYIIAYASYSGMGRNNNTEQLVSVITTLVFVLIFLFKKMEIRLFSMFGLYSYEIYLLHWPILYRYDMFFKLLPGYLAVALYLILFIGLGWLLKKVSGIILSRFN